MAQTLPLQQILFSTEGEDGIRLFNDGLYWEAHEAWETTWHKKTGRERAFYQAMIHVAAALLKISRAQFVGAHSQLTRALERFSVAGPLTTGTNDAEFRRGAQSCRAEILRLGPDGMEQFDKTLFPRIENV